MRRKSHAYLRHTLAFGWVLVTVAFTSSQIAASQSTAEARNLALVGHTDVNGHGDGNESMAIQQWPDGRRVLYFGHTLADICVSVIDVTDPVQPVVITEMLSPAPGVARCSALGLSGNVLAIGAWTNSAGDNVEKGMWLLDVSDFERVRRATTIKELQLSFFDTSGPHARGVHWLWFVDGEFVHMTTGTSDSEPSENGHHAFYMIVDVRDPRHPREIARWWFPGTMKGDACLPGCLPTTETNRLHNVQVYPERPDRAYLGYLGAGWMVMDISGLADVRAGRAKTFTPRLISRLTVAPSYPANAHTIQPIFGRPGLAWASDEALQVRGPDLCTGSPKMLWLVDIRAETNPIIVGYAPVPENAAELCKRQGRYGPYNIHSNPPSPTSKTLTNTMVASYFNGGIRVFRLLDVAGVGNVPPRIVEIAHFIPEAPPRAPTRTSQMNGVLVADDGLIYANDWATGGLYILRYTGHEPLD